MSRTTNVVLDDQSSRALNPQLKLGPHDLPFTLNPTSGCFHGCTYCYSPIAVYFYARDRKERFFETVRVKLDKPQLLRRELERYAVLPSHMKRVQVNETSDYYLPQVRKALRDAGQPELMLGILSEFRRAWESGNRWMVHILTKSHLILEHLDTLRDMRDMVQVEISIASPDTDKLRQVEFYAPSLERRLQAIKVLSSAGVFVRVMAMPFYGDRDELTRLKEITFDYGARSIKNKGLNYYRDWQDLAQPRTWDEFLTADIPTGSGRTDTIDDTMLIHGGETVLNEGMPRRVKCFMPEFEREGLLKRGWEAMTDWPWRFSDREMNVIDFGYRHCNKEKWGYII